MSRQTIDPLDPSPGEVSIGSTELIPLDLGKNRSIDLQHSPRKSVTEANSERGHERSPPRKSKSGSVDMTGRSSSIVLNAMEQDGVVRNKKKFLPEDPQSIIQEKITEKITRKNSSLAFPGVGPGGRELIPGGVTSGLQPIPEPRLSNRPSFLQSLMALPKTLLPGSRRASRERNSFATEASLQGGSSPHVNFAATFSSRGEDGEGSAAGAKLNSQSSVESLGETDDAPPLAGAISFVAPLPGPLSQGSSFVTSSQVASKPQLLKRSSTQFSQSSAWGGEIGPLVNDNFLKRKSFLHGNQIPEMIQPGLERLESGRFEEINMQIAARHAKTQNDLGEDEPIGLYTAIENWLFTQKLFVWLFLEEPFLSLKTTVYSCFMLVCILMALVLSIKNLRYDTDLEHDDGLFVEEGSAQVEDAMKGIVVVIITAETVVRFIVAPVKSVFFRQPYGICDIVSIMPFWFNVVFRLSHHVPIFQFLSLFGSLFWLLKLTRYFSGWYLLRKALGDSMRALLIPAFFLLIIVFFGACALFWSETSIPKYCNNEVDVTGVTDLLYQGDIKCGRKVLTLMDAMIFCIVCVISIDVSPAFGIEVKSDIGKFIAISMMILGVIFMAMPIAIVGTCFSETWFNQDQIVLIQKVRNRMKQQGFSTSDLRDVFDEVDEDESGEIEFQEFRKMLEAFHFTSLATARKLFNYFDTTGSGSINFPEFACGIFPEIGDLEEEDAGTAGVGAILTLSESESSVSSSSSIRSATSSNENAPGGGGPGGSGGGGGAKIQHGEAFSSSGMNPSTLHVPEFDETAMMQSYDTTMTSLPLHGNDNFGSFASVQPSVQLQLVQQYNQLIQQHNAAIGCGATGAGNTLGASPSGFGAGTNKKARDLLRGSHQIPLNAHQIASSLGPPSPTGAGGFASSPSAAATGSTTAQRRQSLNAVLGFGASGASPKKEGASREARHYMREKEKEMGSNYNRGSIGFIGSPEEIKREMGMDQAGSGGGQMPMGIIDQSATGQMAVGRLATIDSDTSPKAGDGIGFANSRGDKGVATTVNPGSGTSPLSDEPKLLANGATTQQGNSELGLSLPLGITKAMDEEECIGKDPQGLAPDGPMLLTDQPSPTNALTGFPPVGASPSGGSPGIASALSSYNQAAYVAAMGQAPKLVFPHGQGGLQGLPSGLQSGLVTPGGMSVSGCGMGIQTPRLPGGMTSQDVNAAHVMRQIKAQQEYFWQLQNQTSVAQHKSTEKKKKKKLRPDDVQKTNSNRAAAAGMKAGQQRSGGMFQPGRAGGMFGGGMGGGCGDGTVAGLIQKLNTRITALEMKLDENQKKMIGLLGIIADHVGVDTSEPNVANLLATHTGHGGGTVGGKSRKRTSEKHHEEEFPDGSIQMKKGSARHIKKDLASIITSAVQSSGTLSSYRGFSKADFSKPTPAKGAGGRRLSHASILTGIKPLSDLKKNQPQRKSNHQDEVQAKSSMNDHTMAMAKVKSVNSMPDEDL